ncbi:anti-repressor SinI family protein [Bacillus sp. DX4.1]|nr:anti-repressor SinI family protein [Bacillus sp. DX4.1]MDM5187578.1 anti-repressor SinI family protein [Bacillus sp. DX4.1]
MYKENAEKLDQEWIDLMLEALDAGIAIQEIEHFFHHVKHPSGN